MTYIKNQAGIKILRNDLIQPVSAETLDQLTPSSSKRQELKYLSQI